MLQSDGDFSLESSRRPLNALMKNLNSNVVVKLKNDIEYRGRMVKCDTYMNIILDGASEFYESNCIANYGNVFIRGNNILYILVDTDKLL
jgi:small nuclear ribonucleoprotein (snRNP)-like protein